MFKDRYIVIFRLFQFVNISNLQHECTDFVEYKPIDILFLPERQVKNNLENNLEKILQKYFVENWEENISHPTEL